MDGEKSIGKLVHLLVPVVADGVAVDLFKEGEEQGNPSHRIAFSSTHPLLPPLSSHALPPENSAFNSGFPELIELNTPFTYSSMRVPIRIRGGTLGAILFARMGTHWKFTAQDLQFALELADRIALFICHENLSRENVEGIHLRDQFLTIASHEIKTPLTSIHLIHQLLLQNAKGHLPQTFSAIELIQKCEAQTRRLIRILNELLDLSRIQNSRMTLSFQRFDLQELTQYLISSTFSHLHSQGLLIFKMGSPVIGTWDKTRMEQVILNLLSNAVKYGSQKPIEVTVDLTEETQVARIRVQDSGVGIPPEKLTLVFECFERVLTHEKTEGLGLGLFITREIVHAHGGTISVESEFGKGSVFTVKVPINQPTQAEHPDEWPASRPTLPPHRRPQLNEP